MHRRSMFFGMGVGILAMVAITFVAYTIQRTVYLNENNRLTALLEAAEITPEPPPVDSNYVIDRARSLGMVFPDEVQMEVAAHLETVGDEVQYVYNSYAGYGEEYYEPYEEPYEEQPEAPADPDPTPAPPVTDYLPWRMTIPEGITASQVAFEFGYMGVVENGDEFLRFLVDNGYSTSIQAGSFEVPRGASFQEIVNIIVYGRNGI